MGESSTCLTFRCPSCGVHSEAPNPWAFAALVARGFCQGCRARRTLRVRPALAAIFVDFWMRNGFPNSPSWLDSVAEKPVGSGVADHAAAKAQERTATAACHALLGH